MKTHGQVTIHIYGSCFFFHPVSLCLLVGVLNQFTFKVIIDMCVLTDILLIALYFFGRSFFFPSSLILFSYDLMAIFNTVFGFLLFYFFCEYIL